MSREYGDQTLFYPAHPTKAGLPGCKRINVVAVNGVYGGNDDTQPWRMKGQKRCWIEDWFREKNPGARILVWNGRTKEATCWEDLLSHGIILVEILKRFRANDSNPVLFLCHGLGGFVVLKALSIAQENGLEDINSDSTNVIFFGTPLNNTKLKDFKGALRACATIELGVSDRKVDPVPAEYLDVFSHLTNLVVTAKIASLSFYEEDSSDYASGSIFVKNRRKVVDFTMASGHELHPIGLARDHKHIACITNEIYEAYIYPILEKTGCLERISSQISNAGASVATGASTQTNTVNILSSSPTANDTTSTRTRNTSISNPYLQKSSNSPQTETNSTAVQPAIRNISDVSLNRPTIGVQSSRFVQNQVGQSTQSLAITGPPQLHSISFPKNDHFVEREDILKEIASKVLCNIIPENPQLNQVQADKTPAFAVWGSPGQGKTQTALRFSYLHMNLFPYILWVSADREQKLLEGFSQYAKALGIVRKDSNDLVFDANALVQWFQTRDCPWLLVFDNAEDTKLINSYWPQNGTGVILLTSRDPVFATSTVAGNGRELTSLSEDAALKMLKADIPTAHFDENEGRKAVKLMGCLPLGIQALIGLINDAGCHLSTFNEQWNSTRTLLSDITVQHVYRNFAPYEKALADVWFEELQDLKKKDAEAMELVDLIALLDPDDIQEELLALGANVQSLRDSGFVKNRVRCLKTLKRLVSPNTSVEGAKYRRFHVHRLLQASTQIQMSPDSRQNAFNSVAKLLSKAISSRWETNWPKIRLEYKEYFPHVQAVQKFYEDFLASNDLKKLKVPVEFLTMLRKAGELCYKRSFFQLGLEILATGENIISNPEWRSIIVGDEADIRFEFVELHYAHACIGTEIPDFTMSLDHFRKAQDYYMEMTSLGFPKTNGHALLGGIANSLNGLGRDEEAEPLFLQALAHKPATQKFSAYEVNISRCMMVQGKLKEASDRLLDFIRRREEAFGPDDTQDYLAGHAMYVLGNVRIREGFLDEAFDLHLRTLKCFEPTYGVSHHKTGNARLKVAWHLARVGKYEEALVHLQTALKIYQSGTDQVYRRRDIARTYYKMGLVFAKMGQNEESQKYLTDAKKLRQELWPQLPTEDVDNEEAYDALVSLWAR